MTTEKEQLEAEIAKRDARIAELERQGAALAASYCDGVIGDSYGHAYCKYKADLAALKAQQPSAGVVLPERKPVPDQSMFVGRPAAYAQAFDEAKAHNRCLDEVERLNPCRAQAVPDGWKSIALYADQLADMVLKGDAPHTAQRIAMALRALLAAPSTKKESE